MFRRSYSREPDTESARHIYLSSLPVDDNDFAFHSLISDSDFKNLVIDLKKKIDNGAIIINIDESIIERKKKFNVIQKIKSKIRSFVLKSKYQDYKTYSKPYVQEYIQTALKQRKEELVNRRSQMVKNNSITKEMIEIDKEIYEIEMFIIEHNLCSLEDFLVEYPYDNLKGYLEDRGLEELLEYINWEDVEEVKAKAKKKNEDKSLKTSRSKSLICNMKLYIKHNSPKDYGFLLKTEAHIRFMNAIWHANKYLSAISIVVTMISVVLLALISAILYFGLFSRLRLHINPDIYSFITAVNNTVKNIIGTTFKTTFEWKNSLSTFSFLILISSAYIWVGKIIVKTIKSNFHYQRIREVVSIIYIYDMLQRSNNNSEDLGEIREKEYADSDK